MGGKNPQTLEARPSFIPWPGRDSGWWCACVCAQLCPTLGDPTDCSPPGSSIHGILQARTLEWPLQWRGEPYEAHTWPKNRRENKEGICKGEERMGESNSTFSLNSYSDRNKEHWGDYYLSPYITNSKGLLEAKEAEKYCPTLSPWAQKAHSLLCQDMNKLQINHDLWQS